MYAGAFRGTIKAMLYAVLVAAGLILGFAVGRWWALVAPLGVGLWIGFTEEVEVPGVVLGVAYAALSGGGVIVGILLRRFLRRSAGT